MNKVLLTLLIFFFCENFIFSQENFVSDVISDCDGGMNIIEPGTFSIQFTGQGNDITAEGFEIWYDNDVGDGEDAMTLQRWLTWLAPLCTSASFLLSF